MVAENMYVMGEIHFNQMNQGGGLGRNEPPKSRKMTLDNGAQTCDIWTVGLAAPIARPRAAESVRVCRVLVIQVQDGILTDTVDQI
jgi:hypothetical protein